MYNTYTHIHIHIYIYTYQYITLGGKKNLYLHIYHVYTYDIAAISHIQIFIEGFSCTR